MSAVDLGINDQGYFGEFGGAYVPEMLFPNIEELQQKAFAIIDSPDFQAEFRDLLENYVGRETPLYRAPRFSEKVKATVFLKREDLAHTGAHKINNTVGQILLAKRLGKTRIIAETGAGQHGVATAAACALMGFPCVVYMGAVDVERQAPNVARMRMMGAEVRPVHSGSKTLKDATNEAMRDWIANPRDTHYIIGSVVGPHPFPAMVARFQSVISAEILQQYPMKSKSSLPSVVVACVGGGSNAMGGFYHFLDKQEVRLVGVEAAGKGLKSGFSAATTVLGKSGILHGSKTLFMQTPDGQVEEAHSISAGLDYPGIGPQHAHLHVVQRVTYVNVTDDEALVAAQILAECEGIIPALETAHALSYVLNTTWRTDDEIVVILSGRGDKDMSTYISHQNSKKGA